MTSSANSHKLVFTIFDFSKGYWYIEHDEASSFLTSFNTPFGRFCFIRMPFGLTQAVDAFEYKLDALYSNLNLITQRCSKMACVSSPRGMLLSYGDLSIQKVFNTIKQKNHKSSLATSSPIGCQLERS